MKTIEIDGKSYLINIEKATKQGVLKEKGNKPRSWEEYRENILLYQRCKFSAEEYNSERTEDFSYKVFGSPEDRLTFPTEEMADEFIKCFKDLLEEAEGLY